MRKIPTVFARNHGGNHMVRDEVVPGCEWVLAGEGLATRKWDGMACLVKDGRLFKRLEVRCGKGNPARAPEGFVPAMDAPDPETGKWFGWVPVDLAAPGDWRHAEAWAAYADVLGLAPRDGTYELCGPTIRGRDSHCDNPEWLPRHVLIPHGATPLGGFAARPRTFASIRKSLELWNRDGASIEGIVFHHPDGRMAKVKARDFGIHRGTASDDPERRIARIVEASK